MSRVLKVITGSGDGGLPHIGALSRAKRLVVSTAVVTDADLRHLKGLSELAQLDLGANRP